MAEQSWSITDVLTCYKTGELFYMSVRVSQKFLQDSVFLDLYTGFQNLSRDGIYLITSYKVVNSFPVQIAVYQDISIIMS